MEGAYQSCKPENDYLNVRSKPYSSINLGSYNGESTANLPSSSMPRNIVQSNTLALTRGKVPEGSCCKATEAPEQWAPAPAPARDPERRRLSTCSLLYRRGRSPPTPPDRWVYRLPATGRDTNGGARMPTDWMACSERLSQFSLSKRLPNG